MLFRALRLSIVVLFLLLLFSSGYQKIGAEDVQLLDDTGFLGIYIDGVKVGHSSWTFAKKEASKKCYYRFEMTETKKVGGKDIECTHNAVITSDLSMKTLETSIKKGKTLTTVKGTNNTGKVGVVTSIGGSKFPPQYVKAKPETMWECCAPHVFAWRMHPADKEQAFSYILTEGSRLEEFELKGKEKAGSYEGESVEAIEWTSDNGRVLIQVDLEGKLLKFESVTKRGKKTAYIAESEKVAKSSSNFENFDGGDDDEEEVDDGDDEDDADEDTPKKSKKKKKGELEGDEDGLFKKALPPVKSSKRESSKGSYLKKDDMFSMNIKKPWEGEAITDDDDEEVLWAARAGDGDGLILISYSEFNGNRINMEDEKKAKSAAFAIFIIRMMYISSMLTEDGSILPIMSPQCKSIVTFPDGCQLFLCHAYLGNDGIEVYCLMGQTDDKTIYAMLLGPKDDLDEDLFKMLGSFRVLYEE